MKVLITGAAGKIGSVLRTGLAGSYELIRLTDIAPLAPAGPGEECIVADISDSSVMEGLCTGVDCIVHLAGISEEPTSWEEVLPNNIVGTYNVFEAARHSDSRPPAHSPPRDTRCCERSDSRAAHRMGHTTPDTFEGERSHPTHSTRVAARVQTSSHERRVDRPL